MRKVFRLVLHMVLAGMISGSAQTALAEEKAPRGLTVEERLEALEQRQKVLERSRELEREAEQEKAKTSVNASAGKDVFTVKSGDGNFQLKVGGFVHADGRFFLDDDLKPATNTFLIRRAFLNIEGVVYKNYVFRIQPDFGGGKTTLQDAYLDARFAPALQLLVGKTKVPFLLERIQSATDRRFVELAFPNGLAPNRDIGAYFHGDLWKGAATYAFGVFNGLPDGDTTDGDVNDDKDAVARIFVHPFRSTAIESLRGLGLGVAATFGSQEGKVDASKKTFTSSLPSYKTSGQQTFFSYRDATSEPTKDFSTDNNVIADGVRSRISPQAYYYWGPLGLLGEYVQTRQAVRRKNDTAKLSNSAWQAAGYYVVTGEKNSLKHIHPAKPFDLAKSQWGALELVARYGELRVDGAAFPRFADPAKSANRARAWAAGINWYLNSNVKVAANYEQTQFKSGASGTDNREAEKTVLSRFEVAY